MSIMRKALLVMIIFLSVPQLMLGAEKDNVTSSIILPSESQGWKWDGKVVRYSARTIFDYIDGSGELYLAYGFKELSVRKLEKAGRPPLTIEIYEMASPEDAYGVFSFEHQDESAGIGQGSEWGGGLLRFWKGKYFVTVYAEGEGKDVESAVLNLGRAAAQSIPPGPEPKILQFLPDKQFGLDEKSIRFLRSHILLNQRFFISHENLLNLNRETQAVLATYLRDKEKIHFLLVRYANPAKAEQAVKSFSKTYMPEDGKWTFLRQSEDYLILVFGAARAADGESLLKSTEEKLGRR